MSELSFEERFEKLLPIDESLRSLMCDHNGNLAIATADGSNCLGFFEPSHELACQQMSQVIDVYNQALPLIRDLLEALKPKA